MTEIKDIKALLLDMRDLAERIIECQGENSEGEEIIHLYDQSDTTFKAENILLVLGALEAERQRVDDEKALNKHLDLAIKQSEGVNANLRRQVEKAEAELQTVRQRAGEMTEQYLDRNSALSSATLRYEKAEAELAALRGEQEPVAWDYEWASCITCDGPQNFKHVIEREAPPKWAIDEGQARNVTPLYTAPPAPAVQKDVEAIVGLLESGDWAEHCTKSELGQRLESAVTALVGSDRPTPAVPDERAAFNAWNNEDNLPIAGITAKNAAWLAWQARAMLAQPVIPVEPTANMQAAGAAAIRFDTTPINKLFTANAVYRAMLAAAPEVMTK